MEVSFDYNYGRIDDKLACMALDVMKNTGAGKRTPEETDRVLHELGLSIDTSCGKEGSSITISGVAGINDVTGLPASFSGTCGTCHDSPNVGNHSVSAPLNIGVADLSSRLDVKYLPVFTLVNKTTNETVQTTDPGRALITGKWADIGKLKGPILRGLAARAPYFHNGSAATLEDVLDFYTGRFNVFFTDQEKTDLIAFLNAL